MSKCFAVDFYIDNWIAGTLRMSRLERGGYMDLLMAQASEACGYLTIETVQEILGDDHESLWPKLQKKFTISGKKIYNERMKREVEKKLAYSKSRSNNRKGRSVKADSDSNTCSTHDEDMKNTSLSYEKHMGEGVEEGDKDQDLQEGGSGGKPSDSVFERFWQLYPRRVGKGAALRAWKKIKRPAETVAAIESALKWQAVSEQWTRDHGQYIPHPATYLNQQRWLDESGPDKPRGTRYAV